MAENKPYKVQSAIKFNEIEKKFLQNLINNALQNRWYLQYFVTQAPAR